jgi:hypothetical protein
MSYTTDCIIQFNKLPKEIKNKVGNLEAVNSITDIEQHYKVSLKFLVMLVAIGEVEINDIPAYLEKRHKISHENSEAIKHELFEKVFINLLAPHERPGQSGGEAIKEIFTSHILETLEAGDDVRESYNEMLFNNFETEHLISQEELVKELLNNQEHVTKDSIHIGTVSQPPTIANWLKDYIAQNGALLESFDAMTLSKYMSGSQNMQRLPQDQKNIILHILQLFRNLKFYPDCMPENIYDWEIFPLEQKAVSSKVRTAIGLESAQPSVAPIPSNVVRPAKPPMELLKEKYQLYRRERSSILELEDQILVKTKGEPEAVKKELATAARTNDAKRVIACLRMLAAEKVLITSLQDNPSWFLAVSEYIQKKYASNYKSDDIAYAISNMKINPTTPAAISEFLQYMLRDKLGLSENDSALTGVELGQLLGGAFQGLAYGNQENGNFEWNKNKIVDRKLINEN